jgi:tRNA nucleotidyltransferase (CCA-adding enzyme)
LPSSMDPHIPMDPLYPALDAAHLPRSIDLISARTEFYTHPSALPTVERGSIKLDLHRRDFTFNTLAVRLDGHHYAELHDYWGGLNDLRQGLVRCLHSLSFVDDPTRMLRAVRFEQRFGFKIEGRTQQLLTEAITLLERVSGDRIHHELDHILDEARAVQMLTRLDDLGLMRAIHVDLKWEDWIRSHFEALQDLQPEPFWDVAKYISEGSRFQPEHLDEHRKDSGRVGLKCALAYALWLVRLPPERAACVLLRLKVPHGLSDEIISACRLWVNLPSFNELPVSMVTIKLDEYPPLAVYAVFLASSNPAQRDLLFLYASRWRETAPSMTGEALIARGLRPGPHFRTILRALRAAWLDGKVSSMEEETELLDKLIAQGVTGDEFIGA